MSNAPNWLGDGNYKPAVRPPNFDSPGDVEVLGDASGIVNRITQAARERLPVAIAEFDVGGLVRPKVSDYPIEKLKELVLSVAQHHLKTIELFGEIIGFIIGVGQAIYLWFTYHPR
jgi:hypothetical protein